MEAEGLVESGATTGRGVVSCSGLHSVASRDGKMACPLLKEQVLLTSRDMPQDEPLSLFCKEPEDAWSLECPART